MSKRLIIAITGASGIIYGIRLLEVLRELEVETHLVVSPSGHITRGYETDLSKRQLEDLADVVYRPGDVAAAISSGSFLTEGMVIAPCSMRTLAEIATGATSSLVSRAADVVLKERRRLVLVTREAPLSLVHLRNMSAVTEAGATVFPPVPAFYTHPANLADVIDQTVGRVLDQVGIHSDSFPRWGEEGVHAAPAPGSASESKQMRS